MNPAVLLNWHYLIFLVPCSLAALMLLLSSLHSGHRHGLDAGHGHVGIGGHAAVHAGAGHHIAAASHGSTTHGHVHPGAHDSARHHEAADRSGESDRRTTGDHGATPMHTLLGILGIGRAPLPIIVEAFFLVWGLSGCLLNQILLKGVASPSLLQALPVMGIAAACGLVGARVVAEMLGRLMPQEESLVVSRQELYGLKGKVAFPVSETTGRIMVYDDHGSLHDESCRVAPGHPPIERGHKAMVLDRDARGNLVVEEIPE